MKPDQQTYQKWTNVENTYVPEQENLPRYE